jgi:4-amino-4-deoxy-L-arabinose transferase-like glycosyltransferase
MCTFGRWIGARGSRVAVAVGYAVAVGLGVNTKVAVGSGLALSVELATGWLPLTNRFHSPRVEVTASEAMII